MISSVADFSLFPPSSLDLGAPLVLGSLPPRFGYNYEQTPFFPFTGCMRSVLINGELLDFASPLEEEGTSLGCGFTDSHCSPNPCSNGGRCIGSWSSFSCACPPQHTGDTCTERKSHSCNIPTTALYTQHVWECVHTV